MRVEVTIIVDIPEGYEYVGFGEVPCNGIYLHHNTNKPIQYNPSAPPSGPRVIVKKKVILRTVRLSDVKPGEKVIVKDMHGKVYWLVGWMDSPIVHYPDSYDKVNLFRINPNYLFIEDGQ